MGKEIGLNEGWKIKWVSFRSVKNIDEFTLSSTENWISAKVPGDVHLDLLNAGLGPDFYFGLNADLWRWVEDKDFWYRNDFVSPNLNENERCFLIFEGIDTFSEIFINGEKVASSDNMFVSVEIDITDYCKKHGEIKLAVRISSPIFSINIHKDKKLKDWNLPRIFARKAQFNYGWDIAPRLISLGIWKPVKLMIFKEGRIKDVYIKTEKVDEEKAVIKFNIDVECFSKIEEEMIKLEIFSSESKNEKIFEGKKKFSGKRVIFNINLSSPKLWWPNGLGPQNLHSYTVSLFGKDKIIDKKEGHFGIKKIELIQKKIKDGRTFYFRINGKEIFVKGFNWTPLDALPANIEEEKYKKVLEMVKEAGANMLRVWGGGIYEPEIFYDLCDRYGIMVWQDFMFACGRYPENKEFIENVKKEAKYIVKRLRNHPCLSLWSGGNENDIFRYWEEGKKYIRHKIRKVLKEIWEKLNPEVPFIPDSPYSPSGIDPNSDKEGDCHLWAHGKSYKDDFYLKKNPKFISEIGHISVPDRDELLKFIPEDKLWPVFNEYWYYHSSDTLRYGWKFRIGSLFDSIRNNGLPEPKNIEQLIEMTQNLQAEAYTFWVEYYYNQPYCGGILLWNVCDCWPQISDSIISYNLKPKKVYYAVKEVFKKIPSLKNYG